MKKKGLLKWVLIFLGSIALVIYGIYLVNLHKFIPEDPTGGLSNAIAASSVIISIFAIILTYIIYDSVDAVKSITNMDGNVLDKENYSNVYSVMLKRFNSKKDKQEFIDYLSGIIGSKSKCSNCIEFSIHIQRFIDNLIWLNFCDELSGNFILQSICKKKIIKLVKKAKKFTKKNAGLETVFDENIKLIVAVLRMHFGENFLSKGQKKSKRLSDIYNKYLYDNYLTPKNKSYVSSVYDVCGQMFLNPISKITYYNYLGSNFLETIVGRPLCGNRALTIDDMCKLYDARTLKRDEVNALIKKAEENLLYAKEISKNNTLWNCICTDNMLVLKIVEWIMGDTTGEGYWKLCEQIEHAKETWTSTYYVFLSADGVDKDSHIIKEIKGKTDELNTLINNIDTFVQLKSIKIKKCKSIF